MNREQLDKILESHKEWLEDNSKGEKANLWNANLEYAYLQHANLWDANLEDADLGHADLRHADLRYANLRDTDLEDADLGHADLRDADLRDADLRHAGLQNADLRYADLLGANLREANLRGANIDFSCWPLWCGTAHSNIKVDKKLAAQLLYHSCIIAQQHIKIPESIVKFIEDNFHRYEEVEKLKGVD
jgi:hypothetical protein